MSERTYDYTIPSWNDLETSRLGSNLWVRLDPIKRGRGELVKVTSLGAFREHGYLEVEGYTHTGQRITLRGMCGRTPVDVVKLGKLSD